MPRPGPRLSLPRHLDGRRPHVRPWPKTQRPTRLAGTNSHALSRPFQVVHWLVAVPASLTSAIGKQRRCETRDALGSAQRSQRFGAAALHRHWSTDHLG